MDPLKVYQYSNPGKLLFGPGALAELKKEINVNERPLIVTDEGVVRAGILKKVTDLLQEAGIRYELFDRVAADPSIGVFEKAAALYKEKGCTSLIGLGGGSSIDVAKGVAIIATNEGTLKEYASGKPVEGVLPWLCAIPTTAGTGSESTAITVVFDPESKVKMALKTPAIVPRLALLDPLLLASVPPKVAAETGADALTHAIESYLAPSGHAITEALALSAVRMIMCNLLKFVANPHDVKAAGQMHLASCMAGLSMTNTGLGLVHALAHPAGAYFHASHGLYCAVYLPVVMEFNAPACPEKFVSLADAAGRDVRGLSPEEGSAEAIGAVRDLFAKLGLPRKLSEIGIRFELQPKMVDDALESRSAKNSPRKVEPEQVAALFNSAK